MPPLPWKKTRSPLRRYSRGMCLTTLYWDAAECGRLGLVSRVVDAARVVEDSLTLARRLAEGPTQAYATTKKALRAWSWRGMAEQIELEAGLQQTLIGTADWAEGRASFLERREPRFTGR